MDTSFLLKNLNTSSKPGDDFYEYAVGGWLKANPIPDDYGRYGAFEVLINENYTKLKGILEGLGQHPPTPFEGGIELAKKISLIYQQGMDEATIQKQGLTFLKKYLEKISAIASEGDLLSAITDLHGYAIMPLFRFAATPDAKNSQWTIGNLWQGGLGLMERNYYLGKDTEETRKKYQAHVAKMFALAEFAKPEALAEAVMRVETGLATYARPKEDLRDPIKNYNKLQRRQLVDIAPNFHWQEYFFKMGAEEMVEIDVGQPDYFAGINLLLKKYPLEDWKAYLSWFLILSTAEYLPAAFGEEKFEFYGKVLSGQKKMKDRFKRVIDVMDSFIGEAVGKFYVDQYFPPAAKARADELVDNLLVVMGERIEQLSWMGDDTKKQALKKLSAITKKIGYPDKWIDYSNLQTGESYFESIMLARQFEMQREMNKINKPVDRTEWFMSPQTVNAYFEPQRNEIVFPAGILQPPFFGSDYDDALNYGAIGTVIGHEITHAFDDSGRHFDEKGELRDWWTKEDEERFKKAADALVAQYNSFEPLPDLHLNGTFTLGENIADLGGLLVSYAALLKVLPGEPSPRGRGQGEGQLIDGLTPAQRFFLSYAGTEKNNIRPEKLRLQIMIDPHSPGKYRVNGPLANIAEFFDAFAIKPGDKIFRSSDERVDIW